MWPEVISAVVATLGGFVLGWLGRALVDDLYGVTPHGRHRNRGT